jgi:adenosylmethionine-8-amino-7-oxononanoate aminotransferase
MTLVSPSELAAWDHRYVWHPFTQMRDWLCEEPLIIESGEGNYLIDSQRRRYLDGVASLWCNVHGHRKRELDEALRAQSERIAHSTMLGLANIPATVLAKRLIEIGRHSRRDRPQAGTAVLATARRDAADALRLTHGSLPRRHPRRGRGGL